MFSVTTEAVAATGAVLRLRGELDLDSVVQLDEAVTVCVTAGRTVLLVDCTELGFCDSSGISGLIRGHRAVTAADPADGGAVHLVNLPPLIRRIIDVTGLGHVLPVHPDLSTALAVATAEGGR
ncbi:STAS domain-containing protein [Streptomyces sp. NPDC051569]|uniref:STAS domain-containing protein n=1 Tax=Streptomyces sp. NPDC051569 TaxID=3365661 RepID=UPI00378AEF57